MPLFKRFFDELARDLPNPSRLRKVRVAICGVIPGARGSMSQFLYGLEGRNIEIDLSPEFVFGSLLLERSVTRLSEEWLARSVDRWSLRQWTTQYAAFCRDDEKPGCDRKTAWIVYPVEE